MAMTIPQQEKIDAFLLYENYDHVDAFRNSEMETLRRYRDHVISAITKVNLMTEISQNAQDLADTQQLLLENAHQAGMAEIAASILHNVGNALNSINTSAEVILSLIQETPAELLQKITVLLKSHKQDLSTFFNSHPQGVKLPDAFEEIYEAAKKTEDATQRELMALKAHVDQLIHIIRSQREYANMDGGLLETHISNCIEEAIQIEKSLLEEKNIRIVKEYCVLPSVKIQKSKFIRILVHLINHAAQAMANQSSRILFLRTSTSNGRVKVEVRDTGPGLSKEAIRTLFHQNFAVPKDSGGLGLHYCATTAVELGGTLRVSSNGIGQGTVFTLVIPMLGSVKVNDLDVPSDPS
jgi:signal transduction histidine kinase